MNRFDIALGKTPPPVPQEKKLHPYFMGIDINSMKKEYCVLVGYLDGNEFKINQTTSHVDSQELPDTSDFRIRTNQEPLGCPFNCNVLSSRGFICDRVQMDRPWRNNIYRILTESLIHSSWPGPCV